MPEKGANVDPVSSFSHTSTLLLEAVKSGDLGTVRILLEKGADPNIGDALRLSASTEIAELLLENGANIDAVDGYGYSLLFSAVTN